MLSWQLMINEYQQGIIDILTEIRDSTSRNPKYLSKIWKKEYGMEIDE